MMHTLFQDLQYALRMLRKNLLLTVVIVASLAIGIGANSAIFSVVDALLLRPLPYPQPDRLAAVWLHSPAIGILRDWPSPGEYIDVQNENHSFEQMALAQSRTFVLTGREQPERIFGARTQSSLLEMLGAKPLLGRLLLPEEDKPGKPDVAILSERVWKRLFNSDPGIVGKTIVLNGNPFIVAGVLQAGFVLTDEVMPSETPMDKMDIFAPLPLGADAVKNRGDENYNIMVRLKPGVSVKQAQADIDVIASRIREKDKRDASFGMHVVGLQEQVVGDVRRALLVLLGSVGLVLLIACANVANLLLTRAAGREKEVAIRTALGAGWQRIARQLFTESVLLGLLGGAAGLLVAQLSIYVVRTMNPGNIPRLEDIAINGGGSGFHAWRFAGDWNSVWRGAGVARHQSGFEHFAEGRRAQRAERRWLAFEKAQFAGVAGRFRADSFADALDRSRAADSQLCAVAKRAAGVHHRSCADDGSGCSRQEVSGR